jgi:uncharacterized protein (DUF779 family)
MVPPTPDRVAITPEAELLVRRMVERHGPLLFHQSGGCCDGSSPMCFPRDEFRVGDREVYLGKVAGTPFYMGPDQYAYWAHTHLTVDVVPGRGGGFSVEAPEGVRFLIRSRLLTDDELAALPPVATGPHADRVEPHAGIQPGVSG